MWQHPAVQNTGTEYSKNSKDRGVMPRFLRHTYSGHYYFDILHKDVDEQRSDDQ